MKFVGGILEVCKYIVIITQIPPLSKTKHQLGTFVAVADTLVE